ncbi:MAG: FAD-dependent oxidoreductase [Christensenellales bacterium]
MHDMEQKDLVIIGGGVAGAMAAVAAGRMGAMTLLVEEMGFLGGSLTACGTGPMMTFHAGDLQVIRGLGEELIQRLKSKGLSTGHIPDSTGYTYSVTPFDLEGMKRELELMVLGSGAELLYHCSAVDVVKKDGLLAAVKFYACGRTFEAPARIFIDATGDADVIAMAGVAFEQGRGSDGRDQPMTMNFRVDGVDTEQIRQLMKRERSLFPLLLDKPGLEDRALRLSISGLQDLMRQAMQDREITFDRDVVLVFETNHPGEAIVNMTRINGESATDPLSLSRAETEGRRQVWELLSFLKRKVPGFQHIRLLSSGPNVGVRSSRRMVGRYRLSAQDVLDGRKFPDGIAAYGYPIDVHSSDKGGQTKSDFLPWGAWYTIPYRCLVNEQVPNLMAAGRNISCSFEAQASTRTSPACCALGQAAGCAAALAARAGLLPTQVDPLLLRGELQTQGAFLGQ